MKKLILPFIIALCSLPAIAAHITGGEMIYEFLGPGSAANTKKYKITLRLFRDNNCTNCAAMPNSVTIGIFDGRVAKSFHTVNQSSQTGVPVTAFPPCVQNPPPLSYNVATFELQLELPDNVEGYTAAYQTCCRVNPLVNVFNSMGGGGTGATYSCRIPGSNQLAASSYNNSPQFAMGISLICKDKNFTLDFSATDPDGDELQYSFCDAYGGGVAANANNVDPLPPPYNAVPYINGFTSSKPLGTQVSIDPKTGIISGMAPAIGKYVVCVCISEYRNGALISEHRKDFIINVADCDFAGAKLEPKYLSCDDFTKSFYNLNPSTQNKTFNWDFGVNNTVSDTSDASAPTFTYPDTGVYRLKLVVNKGLPCTDSAFSLVYVFPGFSPGFRTDGICSLFPVNFTDTTKTTYGQVNAWSWNFGDVNTIADTSSLNNAAYTYNATGDKLITLIVASSKGCKDTVTSTISIIDKPLIQLAFRDTLICSADNLQLQATGNGSFNWTPQSTLVNGNTATPTVSPKATTLYKVELNDNGCVNTDSVSVRVVDKVTLTANADTTICTGDFVQLGGITDGLRFSWTPAATINDAGLLNTTATATATTTFQLTASIGSCKATDDMLVKVVPFPFVNAGVDTTICYKTTAQLHAIIKAAEFRWAPTVSLVNINTLGPVAIPLRTTTYTLTVRDTLGCPKPAADTVVVIVMPDMHASAGNDTAVIAGQPLQLQATGGENYFWSPTLYLSSFTLSNPVANFSNEVDSIRYMVLVSDTYGCFDSAFINIKIYKTQPQVFVPTAFTPNGDGRNDLLRPIAVGIKKMDYFRIYNRWGQLVYQSTSDSPGWDGNIGGKSQGTNSYVWVVKATDYLGRPYFQKGLLTLIR